MLRYYGVDLERATREIPATVLSDLLEHLPPESASGRAELGDLADWSLLATNVADLVDLMHYWLHSEYLKWVTDPDDPEVKRAQEERKRSGRKPPPFPLVPPVAARPQSLAADYRKRYEDLAAEFAEPPDPEAMGVEVRPGVRRVSSDDFDRIFDID